MVIGVDARPVVADADANLARRPFGADSYHAAVGRDELQRVGQQVHHHLHQAIAVGHYREPLIQARQVQRHPLFGEQCGQ